MGPFSPCESLEVIQQTSGVILAALQPPTAAEAEMPDAELAKVANADILRILQQAGGWHHGLYLKIENPPYMASVIEATDEFSTFKAQLQVRDGTIHHLAVFRTENWL